MSDFHNFEIDGEPCEFQGELRHNEDLLLAMQFRTAFIARHILRFGVFLRGAAIMLQIPGGTRIEYVTEDMVDEIGERVKGERKATLLDVFDDCLKRLNAPLEIREQLPCPKYMRTEPSKEWKKFLDAQAEVECGLINVAAEIVDELIVRPGLREIHEAAKTTWWQEWWDRIGCEE